MRNSTLGFAILFLATGCASGAIPSSKSSSLGDSGDSARGARVRAERDVEKSGAAHEGEPAKSETAEWWKVAPTESDDTGKRPVKQMGRVAVNSDPNKHGDALRFRFRVNGTAISGVFQAPGGKNSTFAIPSGTVAFTVDECGWEEQGFPLAAGEEITLSCKQTGDGDCCEVSIPVEDEVAKQ